MSAEFGRTVGETAKRALTWPIVTAFRLGLALLDWSIIRYGVRRTYRRLEQTSPKPWRGPDAALVLQARLGRWVRRASGTREGDCLRRSLLLWWLLRWCGIPADIHCDTGPERGHAWVEVAGRVVGDRRTLAGTGRFGRFSALFGMTPRPTGPR
jgi:hypothetical protein